jgi:hypothetical protein
MRLGLTKYGDYERRIDFHVYGFSVYVVFSNDLVKSINARYNKINVPPSVQAMHCRETDNPWSHIVFKLGDASAGSIAHESWHAVRYILDNWTGCDTGNETVAYHLGFLVDKVTEFKNSLIDNGIGVKSSNKKAPKCKSKQYCTKVNKRSA